MAKRNASKRHDNAGKKRYASANNPTIEAIINELFRYSEEKQAKDRLQIIREGFIISKNQDENPKQDSVRLWIRGFKVTASEKKEGYYGNFAILRYRRKKDGKFTLNAEKEQVELKYHPQKRRPKHKHPDWGHPILRRIKKDEKFNNLEEASGLLQRLHEEYADVSIPAKNKLFIMIYQGKTEKGPPVKKWILLIRAHEEGGFFIDYQENESANKRKVIKQAVSKALSKDGDSGAEASEDNADNPPPSKKGYFTSMVELKRKR